VLKFLWKFLGDVNLTIWLLLAITLNLVIGSRYAKQFREIFNQLNYLRFQDWVAKHTLAESWWVWLLLFLLVLFALNTAVCTTDRLFLLVKRRKEYGFTPFVLAIAPSLMHLCFLVVIAGHAISLFSVQVRQMPVTPNAVMTFPPLSITARDQRSVYWSEPKLAGVARQHSVPLVVTTPAGTVSDEVAILEPVFRDGVSIHLDTAGKAKPGEAQRLKLIVKHDPGLYPILIGNALICLLMLLYFPSVLKNRNGG
jgi:hypothetical protein